MLSIPVRLIDLPFVDLLYQDEQVIILKKELSVPALDRHSYISMPVIAWVSKGQQKLQTYDGDAIDLVPDTLAFYRKGIYTINDLLVGEEPFSSYLIFLSDGVLRELLSAHVGGGKPNSPLKPVHHLKCPELIQYFFSQLEVLLKLMDAPSSAWMSVNRGSTTGPISGVN